LTEGCIVDTTCELVLMEIPGICYDKEFDKETGYDELIFKIVKK
jgi:predicted DNA-binding protein with PD1-like motif